MPPTQDAYLAIFDHDGVLVDSLEFHQEAWFELGRRTGLNFTPEFIHETFGMTNPSIFRRLLGDSISPERNRSATRTSRRSAIATWHGVEFS